MPKALIDLEGRPMLVRTVRRFLDINIAPPAIIAAPKASHQLFREALEQAAIELPTIFVEGGETRQESVFRGLMHADLDTDIVVIHDAARPFVPLDAITGSITAAAEMGAATVAVPSVDTILIGDAAAFLESTPDRSRVWACQTPQTFQKSVIEEAHRRAVAESYAGTDDATLVRRLGRPVRLIEGAVWNIKITTPTDLAIARLLIREGLVEC